MNGRQKTADVAHTVANEWCDGLSLWPGWSLKETISQLVPAEQDQKKEI